MTDQVRQLSHALRLFGVHAGFERRAAQVQADAQSHIEFLRLVLEDEVLQRKDRVAKSLTTRARFRSHASLEEWTRALIAGSLK